jgi:Tol biopolymer transport system component
MVPAVLGLAGACVEPDPLLPPNAPGHPMAYVTLGLAFRDDIYLLSAQGVETNLTSYAADDSWPSWSPDGSALAFQSDRDWLGSMDVYVVQDPGTDSSVVSRLTADTVHQDGQPAWSPSGNRLAFVSNRDSAGFDIYMMTPGGTGQVRLTSDAGNSTQPAWSPQGDRLAFASDRSSVVDIYIMDTLGGNVVNLTNNAASDLAPQWSPDGSKIAFHSDRGATNDFAVWVMNADGSNLVQITPDEPPCELPHWTTDGLRLTFDCDGDIYVANADGSSRMQITRTTNQQRIEFMPRWRP